MKLEDMSFFNNFVRMCDDGFHQGWHERNGGNLSYRMLSEEVSEAAESFNADQPWQPIGASVPELVGEYFLVTGSGRYLRNVILNPAANLAVIRIDDQGTHYQIVWGLIGGGRPTSELPTHLLNHQVKKRRTQGAHRVIYHAHPANIIALTFILPLESEVFTRQLWEMATECPVVFPEGVGVVKWMVPGGAAIGSQTSALMETFNVVVWAHHGLFCSGRDFDETFGLMHTVEKSAEILIKVLSVTSHKRQTITTPEFRELADAFGVTLMESALEEPDQ